MNPHRVEVVWFDTHGTTGWLDRLMTEPLECRSVGFLIHMSPRSVVLAAMFADGHSAPYGHTITIPRGCVKSVRRLADRGGRRKRRRRRN